MKKYISNLGLAINKDDREQIEELKKKAFIVVSYYGGKSTMKNLYKLRGKYIYFPKYIDMDSIGSAINLHKLSDNNIFAFTSEKNPEFELSEYQQLVVAEIESEKILDLDAKYGSCLLSMPCGTGKTLTTIYLLNKLKLKSIILTPTNIVLNQWLEQFDIFYTTRPKIFSGTLSAEKDFSTYDIIITTYKSFIDNGLERLELFNDFKMLIIDEVHHLSANYFQNILSQTLFNYCIGLSATPFQGPHDIYRYYIGKQIAIPFNSTFKNKTVIVQKTFDDIKLPILVDKDGKPKFFEMVDTLISMDDYNEKIIKTIDNIFSSDKNRKILVLSDRKKHLRVLFALCPSENKLLLIGGEKKSFYKDALEKKYDIIFSTYSLVSEGFNVVYLDTLIFATPRASSMEQKIGRINRIKHERDCLVYDIIPNNRVLSAQQKRRREQYKELKCSFTKN